MSENTKSGSVCEHRVREDGIHEIIIHKSSKQAVDEWFAILDELYQDTNPDDLLLMFVDVTAGMMPLGYTIQAGRDNLKKHPPKSRTKTRTVFIHGGDFLVTMVRSTINVLAKGGRDAVQFFPHDKREESIQWLKS